MGIGGHQLLFKGNRVSANPGNGATGNSCSGPGENNGASLLDSQAGLRGGVSKIMEVGEPGM